MSNTQGPDHSNKDKSINIRDLSDFCLQWERLKPAIDENALAQSNLSDDQRQIVLWMTNLADRICNSDIGMDAK